MLLRLCLCCILSFSDCAHHVRPSSCSDFIQAFLTTILTLAPCFIIAIYKKQGVASLGFHSKRLKPALSIGLVLAVICLLLHAVIPGVAESWELFSPSTIIAMFFIILNAAILEDTLFQGYLQTRLNGLVNNNIAAVLIGAFLFAYIHVVALMPSMGFFAAHNIILSMSILTWFSMHFVYHLIFRRYFSIFPVIMVHFAWNFGISGLFDTGYGTIFNTMAFYVLFLSVLIWLFIAYLRNRKKSVVANS